VLAEELVLCDVQVVLDEAQRVPARRGVYLRRVRAFELEQLTVDDCVDVLDAALVNLRQEDYAPPALGERYRRVQLLGFRSRAESVVYRRLCTQGADELLNLPNKR